MLMRMAFRNVALYGRAVSNGGMAKRIGVTVRLHHQEKQLAADENEVRGTWMRWRRWRPGGYARASAETLIWLLLRAAFQAVTVVLSARWLGPHEYGEFVAAQAIATFFVPLAGLGLQGVVLRDGARDPQRLSALLRTVLRMWGLSSVLFGVLSGLAAWVFLPSGHPVVWALLILNLGEVAGASGVEILARSRQARQNARAYGASMAGLTAIRLAALLLYAAWWQPTVQGWMTIYGAASLIYLVALLWKLRPDDGSRPTVSRGLLREGLPFAVGGLSFRLQAEFNKPVLAQLSYIDAGTYNIAQRVVDIANLPLSAMQESLWPRAFADTDPECRLRRAMLAMVVIALLSGIGLVVASPLLPVLLGAKFAGSEHALLWLAWLPAVQVMRNVGNARLILAGKMQHLTGVYVVGAVAGVLLSLCLIPRFGLPGAYGAAYLAEVVLIVVQVASLRWR